MEEHETEQPYTEVEISPEYLTPTPKVKKRGSKMKPKGLVVTSSMILFTPEDREIRKQKRLDKSQCCTRECWKLYKAKISTDSLFQEPIYTKQSSQKNHVFFQQNSKGILFDPLVDRRRRFLNRKFKKLLDTFSMIHESCLPPYTRPTPPKELDQQGRGETLPRIALNMRPDIKQDFSLPCTFSATKKWIQISNINFQDDEAYVDQITQSPYSWLPLVFRRLSSKMSTSNDFMERFSFSKITHQRKESNVESSPMIESKNLSISEVVHDHLDHSETKVNKVSVAVTSGSLVLCDNPSDPILQSSKTLEMKNKYSEGVFDLEDVPLDDMGNPIGQTTGFCEWCGNHILPIPDPYMLKSVWDKGTLYCCKKYMHFINEVEAVSGKLEAIQAAQQMNIKPHTKFQTFKAKKTVSTFRKMTSLDPTRKDESVDTFDLPWDPYSSQDLDPWADNIFEDPTARTYLYADIVAMASGTYINVSNTIDSNMDEEQEETGEINKGEEDIEHN